MRLRNNFYEGRFKDELIGSVYMPYDSKDLSLQETVKKLVTYAEGRIRATPGL